MADRPGTVAELVTRMDAALTGANRLGTTIDGSGLAIVVPGVVACILTVPRRQRQRIDQDSRSHS